MKRKFFWFIPFIILGVIALLSAVVMLSWNGVVTNIFNIKAISYAQAVGLFVLCKILFTSFRPSGRFRAGGPPWKNQFMNLSPEERERFRQEWQKRCKDFKDEKSINE